MPNGLQKIEENSQETLATILHFDTDEACNKKDTNTSEQYFFE